MRSRVPLMALAAFLLCANSACRRSADARHLATVDSLLLVTDSLINGLNTLDLTAIARIDSLYGLKKDRLLARMRDTLAKEDALLLGGYHRTMTKSLGRARKEHGVVLKELGLARKQLADLRNDVEKGLLEQELEAKYIHDERQALAKAQRDAGIVAASVGSVLRDDARSGAVDSLLATDTLTVK